MTPARTSGLKQRPIDRPGARDLRASSRQPLQPHQHGVADGVRHVGLADPPAVGPRVLVERSEQLLDVERDAVRPLVDRLDHVARRRQLAAEDQGRGDGGLVDRQWAQPDLFGVALAEDARPPLAVDAIGRELVGAVARHQDERPLFRVPGQLADHLQAHLVGPVQVVEDEHGRPIDRLQDPVCRRADDQPARAERVAIVPAVDREQVL